MSHRNFLPRCSRAVLITAFALSGCTSGDSVEHDKGRAASPKPSRTEVGEASWYGPGFQGNETANGEIFDQTKMTAAHPTLPMGTKVEVTNLENGKKVEVRINDRGPYVGDRAIDLSRAAARKLDMEEDGTTQVKIEADPRPKADSNNKSRTTAIVPQRVPHAPDR
ncbi:MAG: septal ring lytic transglycosylase RlpA family protein [Burkholderiales bacterium]